MRVGMHVHVAGGYVKAVEHAKRAGARALQVFSSNPRSYRIARMDLEALDEFARLRKEADLDPCAIHTAYLVNLASDDPKIYAGSERLLRADLDVARRGGMRFVNTHLGSYGERDRNEGFGAICACAARMCAFPVRPRPSVPGSGWSTRVKRTPSTSAGSTCRPACIELNWPSR